VQCIGGITTNTCFFEHYIFIYNNMFFLNEIFFNYIFRITFSVRLLEYRLFPSRMLQDVPLLKILYICICIYVYVYIYGIRTSSNICYVFRLVG
jgi:hypothetical protein